MFIDYNMPHLNGPELINQVLFLSLDEIVNIRRELYSTLHNFK